jgi:hypothetical protein
MQWRYSSPNGEGFVMILRYIQGLAILACLAIATTHLGAQPLFPGMLGEEAEVSPPPPDEWLRHMPPGYVRISPALHKVRALYLIPSNRTAQQEAVYKFRETILLCRDWYLDQMERNGFGRRTFNYETESDGSTPKINILNAPNTDDYYRVDPWTRVSVAAQNAGYPIWGPGQVWLEIYEAHVMNSDSTVTGGFNGGASYGSGSDGGVGMTVAWTMAYLRPQKLLDLRAYNGLLVPEVGPYPLKQDVTHAWYDGTTMSSLSSVAFGIVLHEGSHGFNLYHDFRNDANFRGNMMGNGFRGVRGWAHPDRFPSDETRLDYACALALTVSRYFSTNTVWTDEVKPSLAVLTSGTVTAQNGLLPVRFTASDASGIACALLRVDGNTVDEVALSGASVDYTFRTPWYTPGTNHSVTVSVWDTQGNLQNATVSITPATGSNRAPQPFIVISPSSVDVGETTTLDAYSSNDPDGMAYLMTVEWDIDGDGVFDTAPTMSKTLPVSYSTPGCRLIRCRLTDTAGAQTVSTPIGLRVKDRITAVPGNNWNTYR